MDEETTKWYENQLEMFMTEGWKDFTERVKELQKAYQDVRNVPEGKLDYFKGRLDILDWVCSWEQLTEETLQELEQSE